VYTECSNALFRVWESNDFLVFFRALFIQRESAGSCRGEAESAAWSSCCKWDLQLIVVMVMLVRWPKCWGARRLLTPLQTHIRAAGLQGDGILAAPGAPFLESNRRRRPINPTTFSKRHSKWREHNLGICRYHTLLWNSFVFHTRFTRVKLEPRLSPLQSQPAWVV
jgi:hypothetical protein